MSAIPSSCPKCGSSELRVARPFKGHVNLWVFILGGFLLSLLWSGSRKREVRCCQCNDVFQQSTRTSRVFSVILLCLILLIVLAVLAHFFGWGQ